MRRLRDGEWIAAAGGTALLVSLFLHWYRTAGAGVEATAWQAFSILDLVLALCSLVSLALFALHMTRESPSLPAAFSVLTVVAGAVATLLILYRIANQPGPNELVEVQPGAWLGVAAAAASAAGGWRSLRTEAIPNLPLPPVQDLPAPTP
jgi:drug/metabolite transporter (DMT)-like permease